MNTAGFFLRLECYSDARRYVVGVVVSAAEFAIVVDVGGNAVVPENRNASAEKQTVAADSRATDSKAAACTIGEAGNNRIGAVAVFVLPSSAEFRSHQDMAHFPIVGGFPPECGANGVHVLIVEL